MARTRFDRRTDDARAAGVLAKNIDPIMAIVAQSLAGVDPGQVQLAACVRDTRLVLDIARRLDDAIPLPEPVESFDVLLWALVAGIALAIYKRAQRRPNPAAAARKLAESALTTAKVRLTDALA